MCPSLNPRKAVCCAANSAGFTALRRTAGNGKHAGTCCLHLEGRTLAEGAVNTLLVCLNTKLYDITSWNPLISKPFHFASLPED